MSQSQEEIRFGKIAVKKGFLSGEELNECIDHQKEIIEGDRPAPSLKRILIGAGYVSKTQAKEIEEIQEKVTRLNGVNIPAYEIHEKIGEDASGIVYRATQLSTDRTVAIKLLFYPSASDDEEYLERFYRAARSSVAKLDHEGILQGIDVGEANGVYYLVREYVDGSTLDEVIQKKGSISEERAKEIGLRMARVLKHAADNGLVHQDVKPENIMIDREGTAKLCDLDLAGKSENEGSSSTEVGPKAGMPYYMSPEQAKGEEPDIRSDVYALGASLYHAVTGDVPFDADTADGVISKHLKEEVEPPVAREPSLSNQFDAVIRKMMEKDPDARYTPDELITDFERMQEGNVPAFAAVYQTPSRSRQPDRRSREPAPSVFGRLKTWPAIAALLLLGLAGYVLYSTISPGGSIPVDPPQKRTYDGENTGSNASSKEKNTANSKRKGPGWKKEEQNRGDSNSEFVNAFEGKPEQVQTRNDGISDMFRKAKIQLNALIKTLRKKFFEQQAKQYYEDRISEEISSDGNLTDLVEEYGKLNKFPGMYKDTSTWEKVQDRKTSLGNTIRNRLNRMKKKLSRRIEDQSFSKADETFQKMKRVMSVEGAPEFDDWTDVRAKYLRKKSKWERNRLIESENLLREFKRKFQNIYPLSRKSIFQISDRRAQSLIATYAGKIPVERVKSEVEAYREEVEHLSYFRNLFKEKLRNVISRGQRVDVSNDQEVKEGKIVGLNDHVLKIQRNNKISTRSLATFDIKQRISIANTNNQEIEARDAFVFGLVGYLSGRMDLATSWLERASESGFNRANYYLKEIDKRAMSRRGRTALKLIQSLNRMKQSDMDLAMARVISDLELYRDTDPYRANRSKIHNYLQELRYDPLLFLRAEGIAIQRLRTDRMLPVLKRWYNGEIKRGTGIGTVELTYDFSDRNQGTDWERINPSDLRVEFEANEEALRFTGTGLLLHELELTGQGNLQAQVAMKNRIRNVGGVVKWSRNGGYRGMVNWNPSGNAPNVPDVLPAVLQIFQIPSKDGNLNMANTRMKNLSVLSQQALPGKNAARIGLRYRNRNLKLTLDGQEISSARNDQFTRGRSGLFSANAAGRIHEMIISGIPDWSWFERELEQREADKDIDPSTIAKTEVTDSGTFQEPLKYRDVDAGEVAFAINLGGESVQSADRSFQGDPYTSADYTYRKGTTSAVNASIMAQEHTQVYRTQRHGEEMTYVFPLANGRYDVTLYFVEHQWEQNGKRLFNVFLQEKRVLHNVDVHAESGGRNRGITKRFRNVPVGNERLYLDLKGINKKGVDENATLAGVSIKRTRKIESTASETVLNRTIGRASGVPDKRRSESSGNRVTLYTNTTGRVSAEKQGQSDSSEEETSSPGNTDNRPHWIWLNDQPEKRQTVYFRKQFELPEDLSSATLYATCDNQMIAYVNGEPVMKNIEWERGKRVDVTPVLHPGTNVIAIIGQNKSSNAGLVAKMTVERGNDRETVLVTDDSWRVTRKVSGDRWKTTDYDDGGWNRPHVFSKLGEEPWGDIQFNSPR